MSEVRMGLRQRIRHAATEAEIAQLLLDGKKYTDASEKTVRSWKHAAARRRTELHGDVTPEPAPAV